MIFFSNAFRMIFAFLDSILFTFFIMVYKLFYEMIGVNIFDNDMMEKFSSRIYFMLGLFMLLKLSFSFLSYAVNPDNISNKETGVGKLITNTFVVLILIGTTPFIFTKAMQLQRIVIDDNIIPNIIFGVAEEKVDSNFQRNVGTNMAYKVAFAFISPNTSVRELIACKNPLTPDTGSVSGAVLTDNCFEAIKAVSKSENTATYYNNAIKFADHTGLYDWDVYTAIAKNSGDKYVFNYLALISTLVIGALILIFIGFTMDVALRMIKLGFLQLIAPIAIISYIDPKSSKSGVFSKWVKACVGTYADLFMRLIAVNFAIFIVGLVSNMDTGDNPLIFVFIIIGAFMFAKQLPGLLGDILGIKMGEFNLNPWKKIPKLGQQTLAGVGGAVVGGAGSAIARGSAAFQNRKGTFGQNALSALGGGLLGGVIGGTKSAIGNAKGNGKGFISNNLGTIGGQYGVQKAQKGTSFLGRTVSGVQQRMGMKTEAEQMQGRSKALQQYGNIMNNMGKIADSSENVVRAKDELERLISSGADDFTVNAARDNIDYQRQNAIQDAYLDENNKYHGTVQQLAEQAQDIYSKNKDNAEFSDLVDIIGDNGRLVIGDDGDTNITKFESLGQTAILSDNVFTNSSEYKNAEKTDKLAKPPGSK